jgi:hypothetical protein
VSAERWDVFVSYHSKDPVGFWVREFFVKELRDWLDQQFPDRAASVFFDREAIETGEVINSAIVAALSRTVIFVPILSPSYFNQSRYCAWEWQCFHRWRPSAVMPVLFYNRDALPPDVQGVKMADFSSVNAAWPAWRESRDYGMFKALVRDFAQEVARRWIKQPALPENGFPSDFQLPPPPMPRGMPPIDQRQMMGRAAVEARP